MEMSLFVDVPVYLLSAIADRQHNNSKSKIILKIT